jgi:hypothetical protein
MWFIVCASMELSICHEIVAPGNFDIRGGKGFRRAANDGAGDTSGAMTQAVPAPADAVPAFLRASGAHVDDASAMRVICVRKQETRYQRRPQP